MRSLSAKLSLIIALLMVGCSYTVIGKSIYFSLATGNFLALLFLVLISVGTILSLVRNLGGLIPSLIIVITVLFKQGVAAAMVTGVIAGLLIGLGMFNSSDEPKNVQKPLLVYEWVAALAVSTFACVAVLLSMSLLPTKFIPIGAALLAGGLAIFSDLLKSSALSAQQIKQLIFFLAGGGIILGIFLGIFFGKTIHYS